MVEWFIFKVDLEKVYDHVDWGFLDYMLLRFGFGDTRRGGCKSASLLFPS